MGVTVYLADSDGAIATGIGSAFGSSFIVSCGWGSNVCIRPTMGDARISGNCIRLDTLCGKVEINRVYNLPLVDGSAGQIVCTDGSGQLGWGAAAGAALWQDAADPYICTCGGCGITMTGDLFDSDSSHSLGVATSPGAFADVNAACGMFTTCINTPYANTTCTSASCKMVLPVGTNCY